MSFCLFHIFYSHWEIFFTIRYFVFVIVFGKYEWLFISIAMRYADELTLIDAWDALQGQTYIGRHNNKVFFLSPMRLAELYQSVVIGSICLI